MYKVTLYKLCYVVDQFNRGHSKFKNERSDNLFPINDFCDRLEFHLLQY